MILGTTSPLLHPDFRVWFRPPGVRTWTEQPVLAAAVDMRRPRLVGHAVFPTDGKVSVKIETKHPAHAAEIRGANSPSRIRVSRGNLHLTLSPGETTTLQFARDPGHCLHLKTVPRRLLRPPPRRPALLRFGRGIHRIPGGVLTLESNQILHLDQGAILRGRLVCQNVENVVIRGTGIIDLLSTCPTNPADEKADKQAGLRIVHSRNIRVEGITIRNPSHYGILLGQSEDIRMAHVSIFTHCLWGDGIDSMSCSRLRVEDCFVRSSDDCLAVYADRGEFKGNAQRHRYRRSVLWADVAHPVMIGVHGKHKPPGRFLEALQFRDLTILRHCEPSPMYQGCLALNLGDLNTARDITFSRIRIEDPEAPRLLDLRVFFNPAYNPVPGKAIRNIRFREIAYVGNPQIPSVMEGYDRHRRVENIHIHHLKVNGRRLKALPQLRRNAWAAAPRIS